MHSSVGRRGKKRQATRLECFERRGATWRGAHSTGWVLAKREASVSKACPGFPPGEPWRMNTTCLLWGMRGASLVAHAAVSTMAKLRFTRLTGGATRKIHSKETEGLPLQTTVYTSQSHSLGRFPFFIRRRRRRRRLLSRALIWLSFEPHELTVARFFCN